MPLLSPTRTQHDEIGQVLARANLCLEQGDWDGYAELFVPRGVLVTPSGTVARGRPQLRRLLAEQLGSAVRYLNVHLRITVEGEQAQASSYQLVLEPVREPSVIGAGFCVDALVRAKGGWRFQSRRLFGDLMRN
jgi:hypothetical protein